MVSALGACMQSRNRRHVVQPRWLTIGVVVAAPWLAAGAAHAAGGAFQVDDSEIGKPGECKVESWASFADNRDFVGVSNPACVVQFIHPVELGAQVSRFRAGDEWGTSLTLKAKANIVPAGVGKLGVGIVGGTMFDLITRENTGSFINVPFTHTLTEQFRINVNTGWLYDRVANLHWWTWGAGIEWDVAKQLTFIAEVFGQAGHRIADQPSVSDPRFQAGLRFKLLDHVDIDVIYGRNITGENANWITVGLNVRFGGQQ
jgi:hypothetical protein